MTNQNQNQPSAGRTVLFNATIFFSIVGFWTSFAYSIGTSLSENGKLVLSALALILFFCLPFGFYFLRAFTQMAKESAKPQADIRVINDYDEPKQQAPRQIAPPAYYEQYPTPAQYAPQMQYRPPAQREVFIPRVSNMGQTVPYGYQAPPPTAQPTLLKTSDATGQRIEIDERILSRFLGCKTPSRSEWTGAKEGYTRAAAFCIEQGLATRLPNGGLQWCAEFANEDTRLEWAQSITQ